MIERDKLIELLGGVGMMGGDALRDIVARSEIAAIADAVLEHCFGQTARVGSDDSLPAHLAFLVAERDRTFPHLPI